MFTENADCYKEMLIEKRDILSNGKKVFSFDKKDIVNIHVMEIFNGALHIYGQLNFPFHEDCYSFFFLTDSKKKYDVKYDQYDSEDIFLQETHYTRRGFSVEIPLDGVKFINAFIDFLGQKVKLHYRFLKWGKISGQNTTSYYCRDGYIVYPTRMNINVEQSNRRNSFENKFLSYLFKNKKIRSATLRELAIRKRAINKRNGIQVWLFMDRITSAGDNAEFFYRYVNSLNENKIKSYFILTKKSPDWDRLKDEFNLVEYGSLRYEYLSLIADYSISSVQRLPSLDDHEYYKDLIPQRVFLQHGIVEKDISSTWNRLKCNDRLFISSALREYDCFMKYKYGYTEREVKLTGMPRHDLLFNEIYNAKSTCSVICFAPTWRENLVPPVDKSTKERPYNPDFTSSDFFRFYNNLINDTRIIDAMKNMGYTGVLQLHPIFHPYADCFNGNDTITIETDKKSYIEQYRNTAMVITDYSSIAFEYALLNRPVVYAQFDIDSFYDNHSYNTGDFNYENEGFGPVCFTYEDAVITIIDLINNNCKVDDKYQKRRNAFFTLFDGKCSERIYNEILKIESDDK